MKQNNWQMKEFSGVKLSGTLTNKPQTLPLIKKRTIMRTDYSKLSKEELDVLREKQRVECEETKDRQADRQQLIEMNQIIRAKQGVQYTPTQMCKFMVKKMCAYGLKNDQISQIIGVSEKTLRNHFSEELRQGRVEVDYMIIDTLFRKAMNGDTASLIFWAKTRCRWSEPPSEHQHSLIKDGSDAGKLDEGEITGSKEIFKKPDQGEPIDNLAIIKGPDSVGDI
jgi:transposase